MATYDKYGRMQFHPELHHNHKKPWLNPDQKYLIDNYESDGPESVAAALGRTIGVIMTRAYELRKAGLMPKRSSSAFRHKRIRPDTASEKKEG